MAQATVLSITGSGSGKSQAGAAVSEEVRKARLASAFAILEPRLFDLEHMASLVSEEVLTTFDGVRKGMKYDDSVFERALFTVNHLEEMILRLHDVWREEFEKSKQA